MTQINHIGPTAMPARTAPLVRGANGADSTSSLQNAEPTTTKVATFVVVGSAFWSELVESAPFAPRTRGAVRAGIAVGPMWLIWVMAYFIGFARSAWFPGFRHAGSTLSTIADQQLATGVLWFVSAAVFLPVIFVNFIRFLTDDENPSEEIRKSLPHRRRASPTM